MTTIKRLATVSIQCVLVAFFFVTMVDNAFGQQTVRRAKRAAPPKFRDDQFSGVFFADPKSVLQGDSPSAILLANAASDAKPNKTNPASPSSNSPAPTNDTNSGWAALISAATLEDEIKQCKQRLDQIVTTPAKFAGGGFSQARVEFTELAFLFAVVAEYPEAIRWQKSASIAQERFSKMAANCKVGSPQAYSEAKTRLAELGDLLNGTEFTGDAPEETTWEQIIDRQPLMKMLEVAQQEKLAAFTSNDKEFAANTEELVHFTELVAASALALEKPGMPDSDDTDYKAHTQKMLAESQKLLQAVKANDATGARQAAAQIGLSCTNCHNTYK